MFSLRSAGVEWTNTTPDRLSDLDRPEQLMTIHPKLITCKDDDL